jgi:hypothetical protein
MTSATAGLPANVEAYLSQLSAELADLAAEERDDLLAEVEASLLESAGDEPLAAQFGPPAAFAADLRASAGLPPKPVAKAPRAPRVDWRAVLDRARVLAPIWWLVRGYVAIAAIVLVAGNTWSAAQPGVPKLSGSVYLGLAAILAGMAISVGLGLWARVPRGLAIAGNLALVAAIVPVAIHNAGPGYEPIPYRLALEQQVQALRYTQAASGLSYNGDTVLNLYPIDRRGRLLHDVRLFDDNGRPLDIGEAGADPTRRAVLTADGEALNAFPIRYSDPDTGKVTNPDAAPEIDAKPVTTPPLKER